MLLHIVATMHTLLYFTKEHWSKGSAAQVLFLFLLSISREKQHHVESTIRDREIGAGSGISITVIPIIDNSSRRQNAFLFPIYLLLIIDNDDGNDGAPSAATPSIYTVSPTRRASGCYKVPRGYSIMNPRELYNIARGGAAPHRPSCPNGARKPSEAFF